MKTIISIAAAAFVGLLSSCSVSPHPMDMTQAVQNAKTGADHEALVKHYEDAAREMQANVAQHRKLLTQYEGNRTLYGKQAADLISHCQGLVRIYEQAAAENLMMADSHRQMAANLR
jgi:hypothetical protein